MPHLGGGCVEGEAHGRCVDRDNGDTPGLLQESKQRGRCYVAASRVAPVCIAYCIPRKNTMYGTAVDRRSRFAV